MGSNPFARLQNLSAPSRIQPQARPVDTFEAPQAPAQRGAPDPNNSLVQLSKALASLNPGLVKYIGQREAEEKQLQDEQQKNEAAAMAGELATKNQMDWNTAIKTIEKKLQNPNLAPEQREELERQLLMFKGSNPHLRVYYDKAEVSQIATAVDQAIRTEWATSPLRESDDPAAFDNFYDERVTAALQTMQGKYNPKALAEDFYPAIEQSRKALSNEHIQFRQNRNIEDAQDALESNSFAKVKNFKDSFNTRITEKIKLIGEMDLDLPGKEKLLHEEREKIFIEWGQSLTNEGKLAIQHGLGGKEANERLANAIIAAAEESKDIRILKLADYVQTGTGKLSGIPTINKKLTDARIQIGSEKFTDIQRQDALEERERKLFKRQAETELFQKLEQDPWQSIDDYRQGFYDREMGDEWLEMKQVQRKLQENARNPVPQGRGGSARISQYVYSGGSDMSVVNQAFLKGEITSEEHGNYGRTVSINKDREDRDAGFATLKKEMTDTAVKFMKDRYGLKIKFGPDKEQRIKSRETEIESEVLKSIDSWVRNAEKDGTPTRDDLNDYIYNKLMPLMDKRYDVSGGNDGATKPQNQPQAKKATPNTSNGKKSPSQPSKATQKPQTNKNQSKINEIKNDSRLSDGTKQKLIQLYSQ